jgi:hypothetical protein
LDFGFDPALDATALCFFGECFRQYFGVQPGYFSRAASGTSKAAPHTVQTNSAIQQPRKSISFNETALIILIKLQAKSRLQLKTDTFL